jgi:5'-deoxynucleotidase YfbR-like HD superfamily hydrolase
MVVEIKSTDTPEEIQEKLQAIMKSSERKQAIAANERRERLMKCFGAIKTDLDPLEIQKQLRSEWD